ncbi:MAG: GNAT family N-acetyltransferase [Clostridiales bacterium]|nr:GNAT family N-acetyltransferase [Clostridiales bacterium]
MIQTITYKETYDIRHQVMWPDRPLEYIKLEDDPKGLHYGYFVEGKLVSVISVFITGKSAQFRKFATLKAYQGKGYGSKLLTYVLESMTSVDAIWCNARLEKTVYYESFGMVKTDKTFEKGGIGYTIMTKKYK